MPRKSVDAGKRRSVSSAADKAQQKTERSHEENQERAYIAASRRADRSIEARIQSARMASEIHKKRTGKGFRITEEIVVKEEMYEEEEEAFPRSLRLLGPHMHTTSPEMNLKMEAYLSNRMAMSAMVAGNNDSWRQNEINRRFAEFFPDANKQAQQLSHNMSQQMAPGQVQSGPSPRAAQSPILQSPVSPTFQPMNYQQPSHQQGSRGSFSANSQSAAHNLVSPTTTSAESLTQSPHVESSTSTFAQNLPTHQPMDTISTESAFTAELPPEARMLMVGANMDADDGFADSMYGHDGWMNEPYQNYNAVAGNLKMDDHVMDMQPDFYGSDGLDPLKSDQDINWGSFVNEDSWDPEVQ